MADATQPGNWANSGPILTAYDSSTGSLKWTIHTAPIDDSWESCVDSQAGYGGGMIFAVGGQVGTSKLTR